MAVARKASQLGQGGASTPTGGPLAVAAGAGLQELPALLPPKAVQGGGDQSLVHGAGRSWLQVSRTLLCPSPRHFSASCCPEAVTFPACARAAGLGLGGRESVVHSVPPVYPVPEPGAAQTPLLRLLRACPLALVGCPWLGTGPCVGSWVATVPLCRG